MHLLGLAITAVMFAVLALAFLSLAPVLGLADGAPGQIALRVGGLHAGIALILVWRLRAGWLAMRERVWARLLLLVCRWLLRRHSMERGEP